MNFQDAKFTLLNPKFLLYFLPKKLSKENVFPLRTFSRKQKNMELEVSGFNIIDLRQSVDFLSCLENRFCLYGRTPLFEGQEFSLCFQSLDLSAKTFLFTNRKKKIGGHLGLLPFLQEKDNFLGKSEENLLIKGRLVRLSKGGFASSCFGVPAFVVRSSVFFKLSKQKSYKTWFSLNLQYYGVLSYFDLVSFKKLHLPCSKKYQKKSLSKRFKFYYFKNEIVKYFFLLAKPKELLFRTS